MMPLGLVCEKESNIYERLDHLDERELSERSYALGAFGERDVAEAFRALRGCRVNCGAARRALVALRAARQLADSGTRRLSCLVACAELPQLRLLRVLVALEEAGSLAVQCCELRAVVTEGGATCDVVPARTKRVQHKISHRI